MGSGSSPGGQPTLGKPIGLEGGTPALSGLVGQPKRALCALEEKIKEKEKKGGGKGRKDSHPPNQVQLGLGGRPSPLGSADPLGLLEPQGKAPLSHLNIRRF